MFGRSAIQWSQAEKKVCNLAANGQQVRYKVDMRKSKTVVISGYEHFTIDIAAQSGLDYFCIDLELDPVDFEIVDFACTEIGCLGERILHDALLGYEAEEGIKNAIDQVEKTLFCSFKSGIVAALENANRWYKKMKDDGKCFGKSAV